MSDNPKVCTYDERREVVIPGNYEETLQYCIDHFILTANAAIEAHGYFAVALSGGSTPKAIYEGLANEKNREKVRWKEVLLFWSDERYVPRNHPDSNYLMAMEAGFETLPIPSKNIFPVPVSGDWEKDAKKYEQTILKKIPSKKFDLVMLGMGDDGHTASLFPKTHGLDVKDRLVIANFIPQKDCWRITLTYTCINEAAHTAIYVMGETKAERVKTVLTSHYDCTLLPIQGVGTAEHRALWIVDADAAQKIPNAPR